MVNSLSPLGPLWVGAWVWVKSRKRPMRFAACTMALLTLVGLAQAQNATLNLNGIKDADARLTDAASQGKLANLEVLNLGSSGITNLGLKPISGHQQLHTVVLGSTGIG